MAKDYYSILGVSKTATLQEITKAYRKLALKYHPDRSGGNEAMFKEIVEAHEVLSDSYHRQNYDILSQGAEQFPGRGIDYEGPSANIIDSRANSTRNDFHREIQLRQQAAEEINSFLHSRNYFSSGMYLIVEGGGYGNWNNKIWEIEFSEVENYKNQLLNFVKEKLKEEESRNGNPNIYPRTGSGVPPNPNGPQEKCYCCLKWLNQAEVMWHEGSKIGRHPVCSFKCGKKLDEKNQGNETTADTDKGEKPSSTSSPTPPPSQSSGEKTSENSTIKDNIQVEQTKKSNEYNENLNQAEKPVATLEQKAQAVKESGSMVGEETPEQQSRRENLEKELVEKNSVLASEALLGRIENNLKANNLSLTELPAEIQNDYQKIKENKEIASRINESIGKTGVKKLIQSLKKEIANLTNANPEKIKELKEKLLKIICSNNRFHWEYKQEAQSLLKQLESKQNQNASDNKFPVGWVIGGGALVVISLVTIAFIVRKRKKKRIVK